MSAGYDTEGKFSDTTNGQEREPTSRSIQRNTSVFSVPEPIKRIFDRFPLRAYSSNQLPRRCPVARTANRLYVFSTSDDAHARHPSFNPACLKWQAYLKFCRLDYVSVPSTNHASPTGILPFLLPTVAEGQPSPTPIPSSKLSKWAAEEQGTESSIAQNDMRFAAYGSLVDHRIRNAWLYNLYLDLENFSSVAQPLYIDPVTSNTIVRKSIANQLRAAARSELLKWTSLLINEDELYAEAGKAFEALEILLSDNEYFFASERPGLFDASVFAYTHLLLDNHIMHWKNARLKAELETYDRLVQHRNRCLEVFYA